MMRIALLISGGGTTAEAIIRACGDGCLEGVTPACVIASKPDALGIARARNAGIAESDIAVVRPKDFASPDAFGEAILKECEARHVDFVGQYGWMCKTPENVIARFNGMIVNQHPGPLDPGRPDFGGPGMYGMRVHAARIAFVRAVNRDFWSEATAHRVSAEYDKGALLGTRRVPIIPEDDAEALRARMLPEEHALQIETLGRFADGTVKEIVREMPLVRPGEYAILEECKTAAVKQYPHG